MTDTSSTRPLRAGAYASDVSSTGAPLELGEAVTLALRLWWRPLWTLWRLYVAAVGAYLVLRLGGWVLLTSEADLITSAADARTLGREALLGWGPIITTFFVMLRLSHWLLWAPHEGLRDVWITADVYSRRLAPAEHRSLWGQGWRVVLGIAAVCGIGFLVGRVVRFALEVLAIDTSSGAGSWLASGLYMWVIAPLGVFAGLAVFHWAWGMARDEGGGS